jgi:hypothetical protein
MPKNYMLKQNPNGAGPEIVDMTPPEGVGVFGRNIVTELTILQARFNALESRSAAAPAVSPRAEDFLREDLLKYKAMYETVQQQLHDAQMRLRNAAIREERVQRMVAEVNRRGLSIETDSQGNVHLTANGVTVALPTGYTGAGVIELPKG